MCILILYLCVYSTFIGNLLMYMQYVCLYIDAILIQYPRCIYSIQMQNILDSFKFLDKTLSGNFKKTKYWDIAVWRRIELIFSHIYNLNTPVTAAGKHQLRTHVYVHVKGANIQDAIFWHPGSFTRIPYLHILGKQRKLHQKSAREMWR